MAKVTKTQEWQQEIELAIAQLADGLRRTQAWRPEANGQLTLSAVIARAQARAGVADSETRPAELPERRAA